MSQAKRQRKGRWFALFLLASLIIVGLFHTRERWSAMGIEPVRFLNQSHASHPGIADASELHAEPAPAPMYGHSVWENPEWEPVSATARTDFAREPDTTAALAQDGVPDSRQSDFRRPGSPRGVAITTLCYHQTFSGSNTFSGYNVSPDALEDQFRYLRENGFESITTTDYARAMHGEAVRLPRKPVYISFDDGLLSNYTIVPALLEKYNLNATLFIYPSIISARTENYMNWDQLKELAQNERIEIGSHTIWHPLLPTMTTNEIRTQLRRSRETLEERLGVSVVALAYPFGVYDRRVIREAREAGYRIAFTIQPGASFVSDDPYTLTRYMVVHNHGLQTFANHLRLTGPEDLQLYPPDGSFIEPRDELRIELDAEPEELSIKIGGRTIALEQSEDTSWTARLPEVTSDKGYLPVTIRGRDRSGRSFYAEFLYLDARKFPNRDR